MAGACGGLLGSAIMSGMNGVPGLLAWSWLLIIEGVATVLVAVAAMFILPGYPSTTKWLSEQERILPFSG